ncbi:hypothetical protein WN943_018342 [Citrus x changshan-huyou]
MNVQNGLLRAIVECYNQHRHYPYVDDDALQCLPNDILCCIISLLPFKSAVKTSFLSTRCRNLWKITSERIGTLDDAVDAVCGFYGELYYESNSLWGFQFNFGKGNVLLCSVSLGDNKLHLDFSTGNKNIHCFKFRIPISEPYHCINLIKNLHLVSVMHHTAGAVSSLVSNFPFLESFTIAKCKGLQFLFITASPRLLKLSVFDCPGLMYFGIRATRLKSLRVQFSKLEELWWTDYENDEKHNSDALISFLKLCPLLERPIIKIDNSLAAVQLDRFLEPTHKKKSKIVDTPAIDLITNRKAIHMGNAIVLIPDSNFQFVESSTIAKRKLDYNDYTQGNFKARAIFSLYLPTVKTS